MTAYPYNSLFRIGILVFLLTGCTRIHVDVRVLDDESNPIEGVGVLVETGPYFADVRGAFGAYDGMDVTDQNGEASVSLGRLGDHPKFFIKLQNQEIGEWAAHTNIYTGSSSATNNEWIPNQWRLFQFDYTPIDQTETRIDPVVWVRIRDSRAK